MTDKTHAMLVEARTLLRAIVDANERVVGRVNPRGKSLLACAKRCTERPLPAERSNTKEG